MTIKKFIEAAIEGGWDNTRVSSIWFRIDTGDMVLDLFTIADLSHLLLDSEAWKAVGKVINKDHDCINCGANNWEPNITNSEKCSVCGFIDDKRTFSFARIHMIEMVEALCVGKTLEEYVETL